MKRSIPTLSTLTAALFLSVSLAGAADFTRHENMDIPGLDIPSPGNPLDINPPLANDMDEVNLCQRNCDGSPRCMAFTWVRRGVQGATGRCFFKASSRLLENNGSGLLTANANTFTGVKVYRGSACWARHIFNLKFCSVFFAGARGDPTMVPFTILECPPGSRSASISNSAIPGRFDRFCVVRLANDPGNLPNCTDAFGGESHEAGVLGNSVNHACLDTE
jgi:hypothetical protein